jgi:hypothetical protein
MSPGFTGEKYAFYLVFRRHEASAYPFAISVNYPQLIWTRPLALNYFAVDALPRDMFWWHRQPIIDVFNGVGSGVARSFQMTVPHFVNSRQELYALRDQSGLSRPEFYRYYFEHSGTAAVKLEVSET